MYRRILYLAIFLQVLFCGAGAFLLLRLDLPLVWALPALVLWLHFGVFFYPTFRTSITDQLDDKAGRETKKRIFDARVLTWAVGASAAASTLVLCFGLLHRWELLFVFEFIFFEGITL